MRSEIARLRAVVTASSVIHLSVLALAALAATATLSGMVALFGGGWQGWVYGGGFGIVIQILTIVSLRIVTAAGGLHRRGLFAALYVVLVAISVLLGYGFWFDLTAGAGLARETYRLAMGDVLAPLASFRQAYDDFARTTAELAQYSERRAEEERQTGGTCGGGKLKGPGPRQRLRERDAATFTAFARHFADRASDVSRAIAATRAQAAAQATSNHADAMRAVDTALEDARALAGDLRLEAFRTAIRERLAASAAGFIDPETDERFTCPDPALDSQMKALVAATLPTLPSARPQVFEATHAASVQRGLQLVTGDAAFDRRRDMLPLAMGFAVDLMLLFLTLAGRATKTAPHAFADLDARLDPARLLPSGHAQAWLEVVDGADGNGLAALLESWGLDNRGRQYLLAPLAAGGSEGARARRLAAILNALGVARHRCRLRPAELPHWWRTPRAEMLAGIDMLRLYRLSRPLTDVLVLEQIRRALNGIHGTVGSGDSPCPTAGAIVPLRRSPADTMTSAPRRSSMPEDALIDA